MERNMHHVGLVELDSDGLVQGGIDFWHVPGSDTYLYQEWEHMAAGNVFKQALPDPVLTDPKGVSDLLHTVTECWKEQTGMEFKNPVHPVDTDYR